MNTEDEYCKGCNSISLTKFPNFFLIFDLFPDHLRRPILAIFVHRQFENCVQIFMLADFIFKEKSQTAHMTNIKKIFLNINFKQFM